MILVLYKSILTLKNIFSDTLYKSFVKHFYVNKNNFEVLDYFCRILISLFLKKKRKHNNMF